ncbi:MAG: DUF58 domain-containing protein [Saprospiraceae bacterium]|nr:DUF58 domain-containing protein [Bacteroidia bacterium]MBT8228909.1 DUF58 domain-containing protein [Bacteroidia bacterium]NNF22873.1 DUF58 domain-containing protein [Saprospiraceae bacterium]NNK90013.1 DUF58 domain-containing protein [Saprospiraceae bacterium]
MDFFEQFDLKKLENLELLAKQVVEGFIIGLHKSPFHGFSVEFAEHRLYNQGESTKDIDWKVYARSDKLFVKKFEEETNLRAQIVIDTSSSMYFPKERKSNELNKLEFSALAAASLMNLLRKQRDAFGLSLFDNDVKIHTKAKSSNSHYRLLLTYLNKLIEDDIVDKKTSVVETLHQIADSIHKRSLVLIFSDMLDRHDDYDSVFSALQHLKYNKHEVILFHVKDKKFEEAFEFENRPHEFIDMETGERVKLQSNQIREYYQGKMLAFKEALKLKCLQYKIDYIEADIRKGFVPILESYLVKRKKMRI